MGFRGGMVLGALPLFAGPAHAFAQDPSATSTTAPWLDAAMHLVARSIEVFGIAVIVIGALAATAMFLRRGLTSGSWSEPFYKYRSSLGQAILLGLEFLVAADIIGTVAIQPSLASLAILAGIVLIRTFLSFSLEVEIEGRWPWQRGGPRREGNSNPSSTPSA